MPTYLYKNIETGEIYELVQSMRDDAHTSHPLTGVPVKRILARTSIAFKGSGFYANDSRKGGSEGSSGESSSSSGSGSTSGSSSTSSSGSTGDSGSTSGSNSKSGSSSTGSSGSKGGE